MMTSPSVSDIPPGDRPDLHGLLREPVEKLPPSFGRSAIEAEGKLVQVVVQMQVRNGSLVGPQQPSLEQGRDAMDPRQHLVPQLPAALDCR